MLEAFVPICQHYHKRFLFRFNAMMETFGGKFLVKADHICYWPLMKYFFNIILSLLCFYNRYKGNHVTFVIMNLIVFKPA
jgi:hypothetical protein